MAYQQQNKGKFEQKPRRGSMFKNPDFNPNGDMDDPKNYWGNGSYTETDGTKVNFRVYAKVGKDSGKPYFNVSAYEPQAQDSGNNSGSSNEPMPWD